MKIRITQQFKSALSASVSTTLALMLAATSMPSCSYFQKSTRKFAKLLGIIDHVETIAPKEAPAEYQEALEKLHELKYTEALAILEEYIRDVPTSPYTQAATLNMARALEGLERWSDAARAYRSVVVATESIAPRLQAMALYRLSFCYEAQSDDQQTAAVLVDVTSRARFLPEEIAQAELPARLAAAYARAGNFERALENYKLAESGILRLKRRMRETTRPPAWLPQTLYFMGTMSLRRSTWSDFEPALRPLARAQGYLLEAAEMGESPWSDRAANDLIATYGDHWRVITSAPAPETSDPMVSRRRLQNIQWSRAALLLDNLTELKARELPEKVKTGESAQAAKVAAFVGDMTKKIDQFLLERPAGEGLTPEARERRGLVRGKVVDPDDSLERRFIESAKEQHLVPSSTTQDKVKPPTELPAKVESKRPIEKPGEDPNL